MKINKSRMAIGVVCTTGILTGSAIAESLNIDLTTSLGGPSSSFGAAAGQAGFWNSIDRVDFTMPAISINGLDGSSTDVLVTFPNSPGSGGGAMNPPALSGDVSALFEDWIGSSDFPETVSLSGLDAGTYQLYVYASPLAWATTNFMVNTVGANLDATVSGGWNGAFEEGVNYAKFDLDITSGNLDIGWVAGTPFGAGLFSGIQLVQVPAPSSMFLFGAAGLGIARRRRN